MGVGIYRSCYLLSVAMAFGLAAPATADKRGDVNARGRLLIGATETTPLFSFRDGANVRIQPD